ncbi:arylsulfatase B-like isoform X1 [Littorina saxatilis]|uniref:Sulfatase N-terminal domain-containing protein n=2 Tax=Littorina saxatilis TaxID=31220 RepID=A0AAN9B661_9CAEN
MWMTASCVGRVVMTLLMVVTVTAADVTKPPNIIFVVADDLGWNDVGWHNPSMLTPNLNRYAAQGVILNSSYVQYFCSPSRNCFMTGYYPYHTGLQHLVIMPGQPRYVPANFTMLPALLKQAGYQTHIVGKWHLGMCNWEYTPTYRGFDSFYGYYNAYEDYYTHAANGGYDFRDDTSVFRDPSNEYFNYLLTERTVQLVEKLDTSTPLFLYLPYHLCHGPLQVPAKYENMYSDIQNSSRRIYCGMVSMMDESFGNITQALDSRGLLDNTLLVFTTDNGGPVQYGANNWPLRGGKGTFWEGGTRGVAFVWSKNLLSRTGYTNNEMMHAVDWYPTILHMAGLQPGSSIDGVNQWDMLSNNGPSQRDEFVYNIDTIPNSTAIRYKDYKLLTGNPGQFNDWYPVPQSVSSANLTSTDTQGRVEWKPQLYNIRNDPEERHDLAESDHQTLQMMLGRLQDWIKSGVTPQNAQVDPRGDPKRWGGVWTPGWC